MTEAKMDKLDAADQKPLILPGVSDRVKAVVTDSFVIIGFMLLLSLLFSMFEAVPDSFRMAGFVFIFILYDPLFTSLFGGTLGHRIMNLQVKRKSNLEKNILFTQALIRYIIKVLLGWISLLTVGNNKKNLAIHDWVVGSMVLFRKKGEGQNP
jgi:uncharacterized RDD family membrane protein YckC